MDLLIYKNRVKSLNNWLNRICKRKIIFLFISISICIYFYFYFINIINFSQNVHTIGTFVRDKNIIGYTNAWAPRILSINLPRIIISFIKINDLQTLIKFISIWNITWILGTFLIFIIWNKSELIIIFGITSCILYAYTPLSNYYIYPWDYPSLFFYSLSLFLASKKRIKELFIVILIGIGFKETILTASFLLFIIDDIKFKKQLVLFATVIIVGILLKVSYNLLNDAGFFFVFDKIDLSKNIPIPLSNIQTIFSLKLNHIIFVNAGTLFITLLLPIKNKQMIIYKTILIIFCLGNFLYGIITEFRIFFEMIPVSLLYLIDYLELKNQAHRHLLWECV